MGRWMPGIPHDQGMWPQGPLNASACILHRTYGSWNGDYSVGKGTGREGIGFAFLIGKAEGNWCQFYDIDTKCSHAAGANSWSVGIEFEGTNEQPLTDWQISAGGQVVRWLSGELGIPLSAYYDGPRKGQSREFRGHRTVEGSDHGDYVTRADYDKMVNTEEAELMAAKDEIIAAVNTNTNQQPQSRRTLELYGQLHRWEVNPDGDLRHQWYDPNSNEWYAETWAEGCDPAATPDVCPDYRGYLHVFAAAEDPDALVHCWLDHVTKRRWDETIAR